MVYLLDPVSGSGMSQDHLMLAEEINARYPEFRLAQVPLNKRDAKEEFPFAIVLERDGTVVKPLRENEMSIAFIFRWLYMNDSQVHGAENLYNQFLERQKKEQAARDYVVKQKFLEQVDFINTMQRSPLHTYKHDGVKHNGYREKDTYRSGR
jgi:hypothetical protein